MLLHFMLYYIFLHQMAVEHGMGTKERAVEFCPYIAEVMYMNGECIMYK